MKGSKRLRGRPVWRAPVPFSIHARHCRGDRKSEVLPGDPAVSLEPELCCIADAVDSFSFHVLIGCNLFWSERATTVGGLQSGISVTEALKKAGDSADSRIEGVRVLAVAPMMEQNDAIKYLQLQRY